MITRLEDFLAALIKTGQFEVQFDAIKIIPNGDTFSAIYMLNGADCYCIYDLPIKQILEGGSIVLKTKLEINTRNQPLIGGTQ